PGTALLGGLFEPGIGVNVFLVSLAGRYPKGQFGKPGFTDYAGVVAAAAKDERYLFRIVKEKKLVYRAPGGDMISKRCHQEDGGLYVAEKNGTIAHKVASLGKIVIKEQ